MRLDPEQARLFLETVHGSFFSQAKGFLDVRGKREDDEDLTFRRFYPGIDLLIKDMAKWSADHHYWLGVAPRSNNKSGKKADCTALSAAYIDIDVGVAGHKNASTYETKAEALATLEAFPLRPTILIDSGGGYQSYWLFDAPVILSNGNHAHLERINKGLALALGGDVAATDVARILRLPGTYNTKLAGNPRPVKTVWCEPDRVYTLAELARYEVKAKPPPPPKQVTSGPIPAGEYEAYAQKALADELASLARAAEGGRNAQLNQTAFALGQLVGAQVLDRGSVEAALKDVAISIGLVVWEIDSTIRSGIEAGIASPRNLPERERPPQSAPRPAHQDEDGAPDYDQAEREAIPGEVQELPPDWRGPQAQAVVPRKDAPTWPVMAPEAFHGLTGEFVRLVEPHTESDTAALVMQLLAGAGSVIGRGAHFKVEADIHHCNIFEVAVGESSKARKGTSWGQVKAPLITVDPSWRSRVKSGLSSGEGLIFQVRDQVIKKVPKRAKGQTIYIDETADFGEDDKRLLVVESEFANVLRQMERQGNVLSSVCRDAWDHGDLGTLTKNSPTQATGAHISIIGHITMQELKQYLTRTEAGNGFGNRFLWFCVKRSKVLPEGGRIHEVNFAPLLQQLREAIAFASGAGEVTRTPEARELWAQAYTDLSEGKPGMVGAMTSRAEAQVLRLSMIYTLLDGERTVRVPHLQAALAVWKYCEASVQYVFGRSLGDPVADTILEALRAAPNGLTRTEIYNLFGRHEAADRIQQAVGDLLRRGFITIETISTGGRPIERLKFSGGENAQ